MHTISAGLDEPHMARATRSPYPSIFCTIVAVLGLLASFAVQAKVTGVPTEGYALGVHAHAPVAFSGLNHPDFVIPCAGIGLSTSPAGVVRLSSYYAMSLVDSGYLLDTDVWMRLYSWGGTSLGLRLGHLAMRRDYSEGQRVEPDDEIDISHTVGLGLGLQFGDGKGLSYFVDGGAEYVHRDEKVSVYDYVPLKEDSVGGRLGGGVEWSNDAFSIFGHGSLRIGEQSISEVFTSMLFVDLGVAYLF